MQEIREGAMKKASRFCVYVLLTAFLTGLPLVGVWLAGKPVGRYLEFPPTTRYVEPAAFSMPVFVVSSALTVIVVLPFIMRVLLARCVAKPERNGRQPFPWWGWAGLLLTAGGWILAWTRFEWFASCQLYTFAPIWFGFIIVLNALKAARTGHCLLLDRPARFLALFPASAVFWWFFEYLNRFVQNWYYQGSDGIGPLQYFLVGSIHFSTVLPAVISIYDLLDSFPNAAAGMDNFVKIEVRATRALAAVSFGLSCMGLAAIGVWPEALFPLLWLSPLIIIASLQRLGGRSTLFAAVRYGSWRRIYLLALAALICGFFWEMWNYHSLARWVYAVPYVGRFRVFEMPILGYAGYLPFGLECGIVADMVLGKGGRGGFFWAP